MSLIDCLLSGSVHGKIVKDKSQVVIECRKNSLVMVCIIGGTNFHTEDRVVASATMSNHLNYVIIFLYLFVAGKLSDF